jgi:hypothetical protein
MCSVHFNFQIFRWDKTTPRNAAPFKKLIVAMLTKKKMLHFMGPKCALTRYWNLSQASRIESTHPDTLFL